MTESEAQSRQDREIRAIALAAFLLNLALAVVKLIVARTTGGLALTASVVDSAGDSVASLAVFIGVLLSTKKTESFPLGLYKIENVISVVVGIFIFITGYEIARSAVLSVISGNSGTPTSTVGIITMAANTAVVFAFGRFVAARGRAIESPALIAEGHHRQADVFGSLAVLASLVLGALGLEFSIAGITADTVAAAIVLVFIARAGWSLLADGMRVLLDATLPSDELEAVRTAILEMPQVVDVRELFGRSAGRFRYVRITASVRAQTLERAHTLSHQIEETVQQAIPNVAQVVVHYEPVASQTVSVAFPVDRGTVAEHFGAAPAFMLFTLGRKDWEVHEERRLPNPYRDQDRGRGVAVARWLAGESADVLLLRAPLEGQGAEAMLLNAGIQLSVVEDTHPHEALASYIKRRQQSG